MRSPTIKDLANPFHSLSLGFGSGLLRPAPGTWGSLAAILPWMLFKDVSTAPYIIIILLSFVLGVYVCQRTSDALGVHDHSAIVWDEFVGMWIALFLVPISLIRVEGLGVVLAFVYFRLFDILKPWPINVFDTKVHGGLGIMMDDVIAGIFACLCTHGSTQLIFKYA